MSSAYYELKDTILRVENVSQTLGGRLILRDVNLEIRDIHRPGMQQGQVVGLLGPSGIGKTRLFRILAGLDAPDTGHVLLGPDARPVERGMVGVVAQHYPLFAHRNILDNLIVAGKQGGLSSSQAREKAEGLLNEFGLADSGKKYPAQLSGGMRQRAAIAQQFMCSEHYLLMDEPFSGLDPNALDTVAQFIKDMATTHTLKTFVIVTHDVSAAIEVCDTIWLLGRDRDAAGNIVPGAHVKATYNLIERGLAWRKGITSTPEFVEMLREIRAYFPKL